MEAGMVVKTVVLDVSPRSVLDVEESLGKDATGMQTGRQPRTTCDVDESTDCLPGAVSALVGRSSCEEPNNASDPITVGRRGRMDAGPLRSSQQKERQNGCTSRGNAGPKENEEVLPSKRSAGLKRVNWVDEKQLGPLAETDDGCPYVERGLGLTASGRPSFKKRVKRLSVEGVRGSRYKHRSKRKGWGFRESKEDDNGGQKQLESDAFLEQQGIVESVRELRARGISRQGSGSSTEMTDIGFGGVGSALGGSRTRLAHGSTGNNLDTRTVAGPGPNEDQSLAVHAPAETLWQTTCKDMGCGVGAIQLGPRAAAGDHRGGTGGHGEGDGVNGTKSLEGGGNKEQSAEAQKDPVIDDQPRPNGYSGRGVPVFQWLNVSKIPGANLSRAE